MKAPEKDSLYSANQQNSEILWSATPTPFTETFAIDRPAVARMVDHHVALGVDGLMLAGSCGEGPWMPTSDWDILLESAREQARGRIRLAVQVTDNSALRMLRHSERMARLGADAVVVAAPFFQMNATSERVFSIYREVIGQNPLPVFYYDRGANDRYRVDNTRLGDLLSLDNLRLVKDSACDPDRAAIGRQVRARRPDLRILTGDEFAVGRWVGCGMDGAFLGGAIFNAPQARAIIQAARNGNSAEAARIQQSMTAFMHVVYNGPTASSWLTGLKYFLKRLGLFSTTRSYLGYPLDAAAQAAIDALFESAEHAHLIEPLLQPGLAMQS